MKAELDELTTALGCMPHVLNMAHAMFSIVPSHKNPVLDASDIINLENSAYLIAAAVSIRMTRLLASFSD